jgi:hypothetical protein
MEGKVMRHIAIAATVLVLALSVGPMMAQVTPPDEKPLDTDDGTPLEAPTDVETYNGTTVGGPEWDRPGQDPSSCYPEGYIVRYSDQPFFVAADGICDIASAQEPGFDGYLHVYEISWDPLDQCTNLIAADDDGDGGIGTSNIYGLGVTAGVAYWVVTSGYDTGEEGSFINSISCDVDATLGMPAPTMSGAWMTALILVLLAGGLLITRFRFG